MVRGRLVCALLVGLVFGLAGCAFDASCRLGAPCPVGGICGCDGRCYERVQTSRGAAVCLEACACAAGVCQPSRCVDVVTCHGDTDCDRGFGYTCVAGRCSRAPLCTAHEHCGAGGECLDDGRCDRQWDS